MTADHTTTTDSSAAVPEPASPVAPVTPVTPVTPVVAEKRRHSTRVVLGAGLVGGLFGAFFTAGAAFLIMAFGFGPPRRPWPRVRPGRRIALRFHAARRTGWSRRSGRSGRSDGRTQGAARHGTAHGAARPRDAAAVSRSDGAGWPGWAAAACTGTGAGTSFGRAERVADRAAVALSRPRPAARVHKMPHPPACRCTSAHPRGQRRSAWHPRDEEDPRR